MPNLPREKNFSFAASLSSAAKVVDFRRKSPRFQTHKLRIFAKPSNQRWRKAKKSPLWAKSCLNTWVRS